MLTRAKFHLHRKCISWVKKRKTSRSSGLYHPYTARRVKVVLFFKHRCSKKKLFYTCGQIHWSKLLRKPCEVVHLSLIKMNFFRRSFRESWLQKKIANYRTAFAEHFLENTSDRFITSSNQLIKPAKIIRTHSVL